MYRSFRLWVTSLLFLTVAHTQEITVSSIEDLLVESQTNGYTNWTLTLTPGRRYNVLDTLTLIHAHSIIIDAPDPEPDERIPVIQCLKASPALVLQTSYLRLRNFRLEGCGGPAIVLQNPDPSGGQQAKWTIANVVFSGNAVALATYSIPSRVTPSTASSLLVPGLRGTLTVAGCTFKDNVGAFGSIATPAFSVLCPSNCSVHIEDSVFANNTGALASSVFIQTQGSALVRVTNSTFTGNTASWFNATRVVFRYVIPAASFLHAVTSLTPSEARLEIEGVTVKQTNGSHGLAVARMPVNHNETQLAVQLRNVTVSDHRTGPAQLVVYGARSADVAGFTAKNNVVPALPAAPQVPVFSAVNMPSQYQPLCAGAVACLVLDGTADSQATISDATFTNNTAMGTMGAALYVTNALRWAYPFNTVAGSLVVDGVRVAGQSTGQLAHAVQTSKLASVTLSNGIFQDNIGGSALAMEFSNTVQLTNLSFSGNIRNVVTDQSDKNTDTAQGAGLLLQQCGTVEIRDCNFYNNTALDRGGAAYFQNVSTALTLVNVTARNNAASGDVRDSTSGMKGGGAFTLNMVASFTAIDSLLESNRAAGDGGAILFQECGGFTLQRTNFTANVARGSGGGIHITKATTSAQSTLNNCTFAGNTALAAPSSTAGALTLGGGGAFSTQDVPLSIRFEGCQLLANSAPGAAGGALNLQTSNLVLLVSSEVSGNSAGIAGGALYLNNMASQSSSALTRTLVSGNKAGSYGGGIYVETSPLAVTCSELRDNMARKGGAVYAHLQSQVWILGSSGNEAPACPNLVTIANVPRASGATAPTLYTPGGATAAVAKRVPYDTLLTGNTALLGGAVFVEDSILRVHVHKDYPAWADGVLFLNNTAATGGAVFAYSPIEVTMLGDFYNNTADAGALAAVTAGLGLPDGAATLPDSPGAGGAVAVRGSETSMLTALRSAFVGNTAVDGGALYVSASESCGAPAGCYSVTLHGCVLANNTARGGGGGGVFWEHAGILNITCAPYVAPPMSPLPPSSPPQPDVFGSGSAGLPLNPNPPTAPEPPMFPEPPDDGEGAGSLTGMSPSSPPPPPSPGYHRAQPAPPADVLLRACDSWGGNVAIEGGYGGDLASTGFSLDAQPHYIDFYSSGGPIVANLSVRDYYGQLCSGGNRSVVIRAVSLEVFGQTYMVSSAGTASFTDLKLRAKGGWHDIDFAASTSFRELRTTGMTVYVRPCTMGEYLSPNGDQCLPCSAGYYNFDHAANLCQPCGANALCADPDYQGTILPTDGYWHSNFFSEQVFHCPNPDACAYDNRTAILSAVQQQVKSRALAIQAALVQRPDASSLIYVTGSGSSSPATATTTTTTSSTSTTAHRLLLQERYQQLTRLLDEILFGGPAFGGSAGLGLPERFSGPSNSRRGLADAAAGSELALGPWPGAAGAWAAGGRGRGGQSWGVQRRRALDSPLFHDVRRQMEELVQLAGASNYDNLTFDDDKYERLLKDVSTLSLAVQYDEVLCAPGYTGVLCGSCAPGYGSTGPATCRLCPNLVINGVYYALALLLTLVILGWTIRSLLTQSLEAARQARGERKLEVMGEMRLMGRPVVNPSLIAVLDDDELPDTRPQQPIYGQALPPTLEGLITLRAAYQQQQMEIEQSISALDRAVYHRQQHQQRALVGTSFASNRSRGWSLRRLPGAVVPAPGSYGGGAVGGGGGGAGPTQPASPSKTAGSPRSHYGGGGGGGGGATQKLQQLHLTMATAELSLSRYGAEEGVLSATGEGLLTTVASSPFASQPLRTAAVLSDGTGGGAPGAPPGAADGVAPGAGAGTENDAVTVPYSPFVGAGQPVDGLTGATELSERTSLEYAPPPTAAAAADGAARRAPAAPLRQRQQSMPSRQRPALQSVGSAVSAASAGVLVGGAAAGLTSAEEEDEETAVDHDPRDSAQDRVDHSGSLLPTSRPAPPPPPGPAARRSGGQVGQTLRLKGWPPHGNHHPKPYHYSRNPLSPGVAIRGTTRRSLAVTNTAAQPAQRSGLAAVLRLPGRRASASGYPDPLCGPMYDASSGGGGGGGGATSRGGAFADYGPLHAPMRTASATTILNHPWFGGGSGGAGAAAASAATASYENGDGGAGLPRGPHRSFPRGRPSAGEAPVLSPRVASATGMPPSFLAEIRRRQHKIEAGRRSRVLFSRSSRFGRGGGGGAGGGGTGDETSDGLGGGGGGGAGGLGTESPLHGGEAGAVGRAEIEVLRSGSVSTVGSRMSVRNLGALLRRRLGGSAGAGADGVAPGEMSRMGSMDVSRRGNGAAYGRPSWFGGGGVGGGGGNSLRWNEYGVEEFGPPDEEYGTPVVYGMAGPVAAGGGVMGSGMGAAPAAISAPDDCGGTMIPNNNSGSGHSGGCNAIRGPDPEASPLQDAATIKIFISYVQILALVKAVPIPNVPKSVLGYLRFYDQITAIPGSLVSLDCSLPDGLALTKAMQRTVLASLAPLYVSAGVALLWMALLGLAYRRERAALFHRPPPFGAFARHYLPPRLVMSFAVVMYYFYPNTMRSLLSIFSCVDVDVATTGNRLAVAAGLHTGKYWTLDYGEECYTGRHLALALGLGMTGLLLMGVGWPLAVALWLHFKGRQEALDFSDFSMVVYASYRELYKLSFLYWESVIMLRQMAVAVVVVLLAQKGVAVQMLVVIAVVAGAFVAQLLVQPFRTVTMNRLEEVALVVIMVTLYLNLYLLSPSVSFAGHTVLAVVIIGLNAAMLGVFVYYITRTSWEKQLDKMGLDRRRVYEMHPNEIRASLRRRYGPRTAELLTRVVTSAQTLQTAKATLVHTGSSMGRQVASSLRTSLKREQTSLKAGDSETTTLSAAEAEAEAGRSGSRSGSGSGSQGKPGAEEQQQQQQQEPQHLGAKGGVNGFRADSAKRRKTRRRRDSGGSRGDEGAERSGPTGSGSGSARSEAGPAGPAGIVSAGGSSAAVSREGGGSRGGRSRASGSGKPSGRDLPVVAMQLGGEEEGEGTDGADARSNSD